MGVMIAEGWRQYVDRNELGYGWPLHAYTASGTVFTDVSGRRTMDMNGARLARVLEPRRRVCAHFIVDLTAGTIGSTTVLFDFGLNPVGINAAAYNSANQSRFSIRAYGPKIQVIRRAFGPNGEVQSNTQTVADVAHGMIAGNSYRVEVMVDISGEAGACEVMINGALLGVWSFSRAISSYACDADFGSIYLGGDATSGCRGRVSNLVIYDDAAPTAWPAGPLNISYLNAQPNAGETFSWPPAASDVPVNIDGAGKSWAMTDTSGISAGSIKGVIGTVRLSTPDALTPAKPRVSWISGGSTLKQDLLTVQPGAPYFDHQTTIPAATPAALDALTLDIRPWS